MQQDRKEYIKCPICNECEVCDNLYLTSITGIGLPDIPKYYECDKCGKFLWATPDATCNDATCKSEKNKEANKQSACILWAHDFERKPSDFERWFSWINKHANYLIGCLKDKSIKKIIVLSIEHPKKD